MPDGLIESRPEIFHQRLREALTFILQAAAREEEEKVDGRASIANDEPCQFEDIQDKHIPCKSEDEESELALVYRDERTKTQSL